MITRIQVIVQNICIERLQQSWIDYKNNMSTDRGNGKGNIRA
jgi:hypothetical protein